MTQDDEYIHLLRSNKDALDELLNAMHMYDANYSRNLIPDGVQINWDDAWEFDRSDMLNLNAQLDTV